MIKGKKAGSTLDKIGERWYDFDLKIEKNIYCYLCCWHIKKKNLCKLNEKLRFESYHEWKEYISNKYQGYSEEKLTEFSRYLNLRIRHTKSSNEYWILMGAALISVMFTTLMDKVLSIHINLSDVSCWYTFLIIFILELNFIAVLTFVIIKAVSPIFDGRFEKNFFVDYKEIIDDIISVKRNIENL